jgi:hypothetical protein
MIIKLTAISQNWKTKKTPVLVELLYKSMPSSNLHFSLYQYLVHSRNTLNSSCNSTHKSKTTTSIVTLSKSISSGAQYVTLHKYFSHPSMYSFVYCSRTPPILLKLGQQTGGVLLIANHLDQSLWWVNQKHWEAVRSYLLHTFRQVHIVAEPFTSY